MTNPFSFLTVKAVFGGMLAIIIVLGGVIVSPMLTLSVSSIKLMIDDAVKCSATATAQEIAKIDQKKLDVDTYIADQRRITENEDAIRKSIQKIDANVDMLIRIQLRNGKDKQ
jgi:hypothetical protein